MHTSCGLKVNVLSSARMPFVSGIQEEARVHEMIEFLEDNLFFIVVALLMLGCHLFHPHHGHGGHGKKTPPDGSNQE